MTPRILEPQVRVDGGRRRRRRRLDRALRRRRARRARRRAAPRARPSPTTCSSSTATTSRCRRCSTGWRASRTSSSTAAASCACAASTAARTRRRRWSSSTGASARTSVCPWAQNKHGHVLGDVTDQNKAADDPTARGNELGGVALPFHCDGSDLVGLMCLENGISGGLSAVANSVRIHNQLVARAARPRRRAVRRASRTTSAASRPTGGKPYYMLPVFTEWDDRLFVRCIPPYIRASQRHAEAPRLTDAAARGAAAVVAMADDPDQPRARWSCCPATCSSSTTTTCSTAAPRTRTTAAPGTSATSSGCGSRPTVLTEPAAVLRQPFALVGEAFGKPSCRELTEPNQADRARFRHS